MPFDPRRFFFRVAFPDDYSAYVGFLNERGGDLLRSGPIEVLDGEWNLRLFNHLWSRVLFVEDRQVHPKRLVGVASLHARWTARKGIGTVEYVLTDPEFRGQGLGRALMQHLIKEALEEFIPPLDVLELKSSPERTDALALYESIGFQLEEGSDRHYRLNLR